MLFSVPKDLDRKYLLFWRSRDIQTHLRDGSSILDVIVEKWEEGNKVWLLLGSKRSFNSIFECSNLKFVDAGENIERLLNLLWGS